MGREAREKKHRQYDWCKETVPILVHGEIARRAYLVLVYSRVGFLRNNDRYHPLGVPIYIPNKKMRNRGKDR